MLMGRIPYVGLYLGSPGEPPEQRWQIEPDPQYLAENKYIARESYRGYVLNYVLVPI